jgi:hypothetical protein
MRRWLAGGLLGGIVLASWADAAQAIERRARPRLQRESVAERLVITRQNGQREVRTVYNGYTNWFPKPAWLYYGYPHSGDETGIGPMDRM